VRLAAQLRSTFNAGCTIGTLSGGVAFAFDTRAAYTAVLLGHAVLSLGSALLYLTIAASARTAAQPGTSRPRMARDVPYLAVAMLTGVVLLTDTVLGVGLPLWIATYTHAPRPLAGWLLTANALMVVALQIRASGGADTVPGARKVLRQAALLGAVGCPVFAFSAGANTVLATCLLVIGAVVLTLSELRGAAGGWGLRYGLAVEHAQGAYGGLFSLGAAVRLVAGPTLVTTLMAKLHSAGWLVLAGLFLATAAVIPPVVNWAARTRPVQEPSPAP